MKPDIVYLVKPGEVPQLRYSLRSVARYMPNHRVWIFGAAPPWLNLDEVEFVSVPDTGNRFINSRDNMRAACNHEDVSEDFILMHDDMYFTRPPITGIQVLNGGPLGKWIQMCRGSHNVQNTEYMRGAEEIFRILTQHVGVKMPLAYDLHVPMMFNRERYLFAADEAAKYRNPRIHALYNRSMYGNFFRIGGHSVPDVKVQYKDQALTNTSLPFFSTSEASFEGLAGDYLRYLFPNTCRYEVE